MNCGLGFTLSLVPSPTKGGAKKGKKTGQNMNIHHSEKVMSSKTKKVASKALVSHWNGGKTTFDIPHQENLKINIRNPNP